MSYLAPFLLSRKIFEQKKRKNNTGYRYRIHVPIKLTVVLNDNNAILILIDCDVSVFKTDRQSFIKSISAIFLLTFRMHLLLEYVFIFCSVIPRKFQTYEGSMVYWWRWCYVLCFKICFCFSLIFNVATSWYIYSKYGLCLKIISFIFMSQ